VVAITRDVCVVTGIDDGAPPLLGQLACSDKRDILRLSQYPWAVVVPCDMVEPVDRARADAEALEFGRSTPLRRLPTLRIWRPGGAATVQRQAVVRVVGGCAARWATLRAALLQRQRCRMHVEEFVPSARRTAADGVAARYRRGGPLRTAADLYDEVPLCWGKADTSKEAFARPWAAAPWRTRSKRWPHWRL